MDRFARMVHYFISRGKSDPFMGKTKLFKLCYFADFDFYEMYERSITQTRYRKLEHGPAPLPFDMAVATLERNSSIKVEEPVEGSYSKFTYHCLVEPDMSMFSEEEINVLNFEFERFKNMTANQISEFSHKDVPWIITDMKGEIPYEAVFYRDAVTSVLDFEEEEEVEEVAVSE